MSLILSETRERLLKAIIAQVPPERIAEIHFFSPIKQGGVESGVAVVAAVPESEPLAEEVATATDEHAEEQRDAEETTVQSVDEPAAEMSDESVEDLGEDAPDVTSEDQAAAATETASDESPAAVSEQATTEANENAEVDAATGDEAVGTPDAPAPDTSSKRHVIYTARYRYTLKGPDRGKWETNVKAEADAPLITVDTVVRGVQRRAGDVDEPERVSGDDIRTVTNAWAAAMLPGGAPAPR